MADETPPDPAFEALLHHIQERRGLDFRGYKRTSLRRRITLRLEAVGVADFGTYQSHLEADPGEFEHLLDTVLINVTSFFRDAEAWDVLRDRVIPALIAAAEPDGVIRVWSVGCASGEEPFSIAMLLAEALGIGAFCNRVRIYATDLDEDALKAARLATYTPREVEGVPPALLARYFERTHNHYMFERELRKCVMFGKHNVVHDAPISRIDLLVCRNLLIYLETGTQAVVLPRLHDALNADGFLFLGKAETQLGRSPLFKAVDTRHRVFGKLAQEWRRPADGGVDDGRARPADSQLPGPMLLEAVLNEAGTAMLVVDEAGSVLLANTPARDLLGVGESDIGRPFQDLPISCRPMELRGPIGDVFRTRRAIRLEDQEYRLTQTDVLRLTIDLRPLAEPDGGIHAVLLTFKDTTRMHALQIELEAAQETLENTIEELQSANEELETLNEEARSSNAEMAAINGELRIQAQQAASYRIYLESALRSINGGIVVLSPDHAIRSWNRWSENVWGLRAEDVADTDFDALDIGLPVRQLREAMATVQHKRAEQVTTLVEAIDRRGRRILCKITVAGLLDVDEVGQGGLILLFQDVTEDQRRDDGTRRS